VSPATLEIVRLAMRRVVHGENGTGRLVRIPGISVAGKSGTAQVPNRENDDAWFVAFAPFEDPQIAVAVVVEAGGAGGAVAGPVTRKVLEAYFATRQPMAAQSTPSVRPRRPESGEPPGPGGAGT